MKYEQKLIDYFIETDKFFHEETFKKRLTFAEQRGADIEKFSEYIYKKYALNKNCLLLPYGVVNILYKEAYPKIGEEWFKAMTVLRYMKK